MKQKHGKEETKSFMTAAASSAGVFYSDNFYNDCQAGEGTIMRSFKVFINFLSQSDALDHSVTFFTSTATIYLLPKTVSSMAFWKIPFVE